MLPQPIIQILHSNTYMGQEARASQARGPSQIDPATSETLIGIRQIRPTVIPKLQPDTKQTK